MTLTKSILLGSAAGIVAVASAQAADLPTHKGAPVQYVQICNVGGITGWTLPGSDTCVKFSGYITAQFVAGNVNTQYNYGSIGDVNAALASSNPAAALGGYVNDFGPAFTTAQAAAFAAAIAAGASVNAATGAGIAAGQAVGSAAGAVSTLTAVGVNPSLASVLAAASALDPRATQRVLIAASPFQQNTNFFRSETGWTGRANFGFDLASNTGYGPLIGHFDLNVDVGSGFDPLQYPSPSNIAYLNLGYLTWAGITAGKAASFFSFIGGGDNFANIFSPDQKGFNQPVLMAYTASFGGGFSASLAAQNPGSEGASGGGTDATGAYFNTNSGPLGATFNPTNITFGGQRWPDVVGQLHVKQGWGEAQVSGVLHDVNVEADGFNDVIGCGVSAFGVAANLRCNGSETKTGWGVDAGVKLNLQNGWGGFWGSGDNIVVTGAYSESAVWFSGLPEGMWTDNGAVNGNGQPMWLADAFFNPLTNQWSTPSAWSVTSILEHHFTPQFYVDLEGSVGGIEWSNMGSGCNVFFLGATACTLGQLANGPMSPHATSWIIGADLGWTPVTNLNFDLELMYQDTNQARPSGFLGTIYNLNPGAAGTVTLNGIPVVAPATASGVFVPGAWEGNSSGFQGRIRITRYF